MAGNFYLVGALLMGAMFLYYGIQVAREKTIPPGEVPCSAWVIPGSVRAHAA